MPPLLGRDHLRGKMPLGPPTQWGPQSSGQVAKHSWQRMGAFHGGGPLPRASEQLLELFTLVQQTSHESHLCLCYDVCYLQVRALSEAVSLLVGWGEAVTRYLKALSNKWEKSAPIRTNPSSTTALHNRHLRQKN